MRARIHIHIHTYPALTAGPDQLVNCAGRRFQFNGVFDEYATQADVYCGVGEPLLDGVLEGKSAAIMCYGQTGSGKTHTMVGADPCQVAEQIDKGCFAEAPGLGLAPRVLAALFDRLEKSSRCSGAYTVTCSMLEIYCERVVDLLGDRAFSVAGRVGSAAGSRPGSASAQPMDMMGGEAGTDIRVVGAATVEATSATDALELLSCGAARRATAATKCNDASSRGHAIFIATVSRQVAGSAVTAVSQLYLCDLAGSEKVRKTGARGVRLVEGSKINTSLLALHKVIFALASGKRGHIPYRDSKLTRLLQNALGGSGRATIVCTVDTRISECDETLSTLRFGAAANTVENTVTARLEHRTQDEWASLLASARAEIRRLRAELIHTGASVGGLGGKRDRDKSWAARASGVTAVPGIAAAGGLLPRVPRLLPAAPSAALAIQALATCPLTHELFSSPVVAADGHTYEELAFRCHLDQNGPVSPVTRAPLVCTATIPNLAVARAAAPLRRRLEAESDGILCLPDTVLIELVLSRLFGLDIAAVGATCRRLYRLAQTEAVWAAAVLRDYPLPWSRIDCRSAEDQDAAAELAEVGQHRRVYQPL